MGNVRDHLQKKNSLNQVAENNSLVWVFPRVYFVIFHILLYFQICLGLKSKLDRTKDSACLGVLVLVLYSYSCLFICMLVCCDSVYNLECTLTTPVAICAQAVLARH